MNCNETIARWTGKFREVSELVARGELFRVYPDRINIVVNDGGGSQNWSPDTDIERWHGGDGLLRKIEEKGEAFILCFIRALEPEVAPYGTNRVGMLNSYDFLAWRIRRAEAPQLAAALFKCIEGESHA